jgi:TolB protein
VQKDLKRSGRFKPLPKKDMLAQPHRAKDVLFRNWRAVDADDLVVGTVEATGNGYKVTFQLLDVYRGNQVASYTVTAGRGRLRAAAHHVSDLIYEALTGKPGIFSTQIAYITLQGSLHHRTYRLMMADQDGHNPRTLVRQNGPLLSPAWSPNGKLIAYVSLSSAHYAIYIQDIATGQVRKVASKPGINSAPAWSPHGKYLALTLSLRGNPDIYILNLSNGNLRRLTDSTAIDTEPNWAPDGKSLVFASDRGGNAQIYRIPVSGGHARRITYSGKSNQGPIFSPDGKSIAMVHQDDQGYRIAIMNLATGNLDVVSKVPLDESPSFAPNGDMLIYGTRLGAQGGALAEVAVGTDAHVRLIQPGDVQEPAWSPFLH